MDTRYFISGKATEKKITWEEAFTLAANASLCETTIVKAKGRAKPTSAMLRRIL